MKKPAFDRLAETYDKDIQSVTSFSGHSIDYFREYKIKEIHRVLKENSMKHPRTILDFGCGIGSLSPYIRKYFPDAEIYGLDISSESISIAKEKQKAYNINYAIFDSLISGGVNFPFDVEEFDLVILSCVLHHIPEREQLNTLSFLQSVMNQESLLFIFELNPYNPLMRLVFRKYDRKEDENAEFIYPGKLKQQMKKCSLNVLEHNYTLFFPGLLSVFVPLEVYLKRIPFGAQYYIMASRLI